MSQLSSGLAPTAVGVGFKPRLFEAIIDDTVALDFFEIHAENYMTDGGLYHEQLHRLRDRHALSIHGVGLSLGGVEPLDRLHLHRLKQLCEGYQPAWVSEHLAWSTQQGIFLNDLLPLVYDEATLKRVIAHVNQTQDYLERQVLLENPASYLNLTRHTLEEADFLREVVDRTNCGLLLDVNNLYVSASNLGFESGRYLDRLPIDRIEEIHLAGHSADLLANGEVLLIDNHGAAIASPVWRLYEEVLARIGPRATLIEWDTHIPEWPALRAEAEQARNKLQQSSFLNSET